MMDVNDIAWLQLNKFCSLDFKIVGMACQVINDIVWLQMCITSYIINSKPTASQKKKKKKLQTNHSHI